MEDIWIRVSPCFSTSCLIDFVIRVHFLGVEVSRGNRIIEAIIICITNPVYGDFFQRLSNSLIHLHNGCLVNLMILRLISPFLD